MYQFISYSQQETQELGAQLAKGLHGGELIAFIGGLGVGKTTLCKGLAAQLGCQDEVSSPTFSIVNYYRGPIPFAHFDAYRISSIEDLEISGFYDYLDQGAVVAVEWSEQITAWIHGPMITITITILDSETREFTIEGASWL